ncbi:hypothetical protein [Solibacillus sp. FSL H8-0538]|uniref:hypothetical protein n=1 Tax=Solibacillus sp. FSL H8-0538 TaxID=2921400 RepID=UPI0030FB3932
MRKWLITLFSASLLLTACESDEANLKKINDAATIKESDVASIEVNKSLLHVEVTLPASFFKDTTEEQIISDAESKGFSDVNVNKDGTVTYKMAKSKHKELMTVMEKQGVTTVKKILNSKDYPAIQEILYNSDFSKFDVRVNREQYKESYDGFVILGLAMTGMYYGAFDGKNGDDLKVTFHMIDAATDEEFETTVYPDAFDEKATTE